MLKPGMCLTLLFFLQILNACDSKTITPEIIHFPKYLVIPPCPGLRLDFINSKGGRLPISSGNDLRGHGGRFNKTENGIVMTAEEGVLICRSANEKIYEKKLLPEFIDMDQFTNNDKWKPPTSTSNSYSINNMAVAVLAALLAGILIGARGRIVFQCIKNSKGGGDDSSDNHRQSDEQQLLVVSSGTEAQHNPVGMILIETFEQPDSIPERSHPSDKSQPARNQKVVNDPNYDEDVSDEMMNLLRELSSEIEDDADSDTGELKLEKKENFEKRVRGLNDRVCIALQELGAMEKKIMELNREIKDSTDPVSTDNLREKRKELQYKISSKLRNVELLSKLEMQPQLKQHNVRQRKKQEGPLNPKDSL